MSTLNHYIRCDKFQMLTISQVRTLLPRGAVTISIDLTDAYWHVPIARCLTPWFQSGKPGLRLQSYALRAKCSTPSFHQTRRHGGTSSSPKRGASGSLLGRLDRLGPIRGRMYPVHQSGHRPPGIPRISDQLAQVSPHSSIQVRVAGPRVGSGVTHPVSPDFQKTEDREVNETIPQMSSGVPQAPGKGAGIPPIRFSYRLCPESQAQGHQQSLAKKREFQASGQTQEDSSSSSEAALSVDNIPQPVQVSSFPLPPSFHSDPYGRVAEWLGRSSPLQIGSRDLVDDLSKLPHQCPGSYGGPSDSQKDPSEETFPHPSGSGQSGDCPLPEQEGFQITTDQPRVDSDLLPGSADVLAPLSNSPGGSSQRSCGFSFPDDSLGVGMVAGRSVVPLDSGASSPSPGGSLCDGVQYQTPIPVSYTHLTLPTKA